MFIAEREGFEPPAPLSAAVFKTAVIDHSTISPKGEALGRDYLRPVCGFSAAKVIYYFCMSNYSAHKIQKSLFLLKNRVLQSAYLGGTNFFANIANSFMA